jgi:hypothetical protein
VKVKMKVPMAATPASREVGQVVEVSDAEAERLVAADFAETAEPEKPADDEPPANDEPEKPADDEPPANDEPEKPAEPEKKPARKRHGQKVETATEKPAETPED